MADSLPFPRSAPEAQGLPSGAILDFVDAVERKGLDLHGVILLRHGAVVAENYWAPYGPSDPHMLFSLSKSFTSTAIGLLVAEGRLSIDDHVLDFFPEDAPANPDAHLRALRVRHLLTMTTGHDPDPTRVARESGQSWTKAFFGQPLLFEPGTHFIYNSLGTYMLSAIAQKITGERILHYLGPRLFVPLGIAQPTWQTSPQGIDTGGWGLSLTTPDIARFGQLYLQRGVWQGARLLPESWVAQATSRQVPNDPAENPDWEQGYGFQFWRCRHGAYRGDGMFGQYCVVMPDQDAVLAVTSGVMNMQTVLDQVWAHLLPAMGAAPLPTDPAAAARLANRLARAEPASAASPLAAKLSGREFALEANPEGISAIGLAFGADGGSLTIRDDGGAQSIPFGYGGWLRGSGHPLGTRGIHIIDATPFKVAATGAWKDDRTLVLKLCWPETPFRRALTCRFEGECLEVDQQANVSFGPAELPRLEGRAVAGEGETT